MSCIKDITESLKEWNVSVLGIFSTRRTILQNA